MKTVTQGDWNVSVMTEGNRPGARLSVFKSNRSTSKTMFARGDHDGRVFPTSEEAFSFALDRGYLQIFRTGWCQHCREQHTFLGKKSGFCHKTSTFV